MRMASVMKLVVRCKVKRQETLSKGRWSVRSAVPLHRDAFWWIVEVDAMQVLQSFTRTAPHTLRPTKKLERKLLACVVCTWLGTPKQRS